MAGNTNSASAIGVVETLGIVALTAGIEAMIKNADVRRCRASTSVSCAGCSTTPRCRWGSVADSSSMQRGRARQMCPVPCAHSVIDN